MRQFFQCLFCLLIYIGQGYAASRSMIDMPALLGFSGNVVHAKGHAGVFKGVRGAETMRLHGQWLAKSRHLITHKDLIELHAEAMAAKHPLVALIAGRHHEVSALMKELTATGAVSKMLEHKQQGNVAVIQGLNQSQFSIKKVQSGQRRTLAHALGSLQAAAGVQPAANDQLTLFSGQAQFCDRFVALPMTQSCCAKSLSHHTVVIQHCSAEEYRLAAARRAGRARYIGSYCRHAITPGLTKQCISQRAVYCVFPSVMARHMQETARAQLTQGRVSREEHITWRLFSRKPHWNHYEINGIQLAVWSNNQMSHAMLPVQLTVNKSLHLFPGQTQRLPGMRMSVVCQANHCQGTAIAHGVSKQIPLNHYHKIYLGSSWVKQQDCSAVQGKKTLFYCFLLHSVVSDRIALAAIDWYLEPGFHLSGRGQCSDEICRLSLSYHYQRLAWSVPRTCALAKKHRLSLAPGVSLALHCLADPVVFAVCPLGHACGSLPTSPYNFIAKSVNGWQKKSFNTRETEWHSLGAGIKAKGYCLSADHQCHWSLRWAPLTMGKHSVDELISWGMFVHDRQAKLVTASGITVRPFTRKVKAGDLSGASGVIYLTSTGGASSYRFSLPLAIPRHHPLSLAAGDLALKVWGGCHLVSGRCDYHLVHAITLPAMPWGSAKHPHCEGFLPKVFHSLELSHFPWGRYVNLNSMAWHKMVPTIATENPLSPNPNRQGLQVIQLTPSEGYGPFKVTALFAAYLVHGARVNAIRVDWGDGVEETLADSARMTYQGHEFFQAIHRYRQPIQHKSIIEVVHAVFYSEQGNVSAQAKVVNIWQTPLENHASGQGFLQEVKPPHRARNF